MKNASAHYALLPNFSVCGKWAAVLLLGCGLASANAYANGEISFVSGKAQIISASKDVREAGKGTRIVPGETLQTGADGEIHAIMDDNTVLAVRPNSTLRIEELVANGDEKDRAVLALLRGQLRSITGWIGKIAPKNYAIRTPTSTIGIRGTDHEVAVVEQGDGAGTYDKVNAGETVIKTAGGDTVIQTGKVGFAKKDAKQPPVVLAAVPPFYLAPPHENLVEEDKVKAEKTTTERLKRKQDEIRRQGGVNPQGNTKISEACTSDTAAMNAFNEFLRAYELGNTALIRNKLDAAMIGYQRFIDGIIQDNNRFKQLRLFIKDTQLQCGPDITVIQTLWEKRYLDVNTFLPVLVTGRATILMHRDQGGWKFAAVVGDNPFSTPAPAAVMTPGAISFTSPALVAPGTEVTSAAATISGITIPVAVSIAGGTYSINGGAFTSAPGTVSSGQTVAVRVTSSSTPSGVAAATLTVGAISGTFTVTTWDVVPNGFGFVSPPLQAPSTIVTSAPVTISGFTAPVPISIAGGAYSVNGGAFNSTPGTVTSGQTVAVRLTSSGAPGGVATATLTVGTISGTFTVTTWDAVPNGFSFASPPLQAPSTIVTSTPVTISGFTAPAPISVAGGDYSVNGGAFTSAPGTVTSGQTVAVRLTSSGAPGGVATATLTVGTISGTFTVTTWDVVPNGFSFASPPVQAPSTIVTSVPATISGITASSPISIAGGTYSVNGGAFTSAAGTIANGQAVAVRVTASGAPGGVAMATLTIGTISGTFMVTTWDDVPNPLPNFNNGTETNVAMVCPPLISNTLTVTGITTSISISVSGPSAIAAYSINGGAFTSVPGRINNNDQVRVRADGSPPFAAPVLAVRATLIVGASTMATFSILCN